MKERKEIIKTFGEPIFKIRLIFDGTGRFILEDYAKKLPRYSAKKRQKKMAELFVRPQ